MSEIPGMSPQETLLAKNLSGIVFLDLFIRILRNLRCIPLPSIDVQDRPQS